MPRLFRLFPFRFFACAMLVAIFFGPGQAFADAEKALKIYDEANAALKELQGGSPRAAQREPWEKLVARFEAAAKEDPDGPRAAPARYRMALATQELARRSFRRVDYENAVKLYDVVLQRYPKHVLADDALVAIAHIKAERLNDPKGAREACNRVLAEYPSGDVVVEAREILKALDSGTATAGAGSGGGSSSGGTSSSGSSSGGSSSSGAAAPRAPVFPSQIHQIAWVADNDTATITISLSRNTSWRYQYVPPDAGSGRPPRLYVEFDDAKPDDAVRPGATIAGAMFSRVRLEQPTASKCRLVLDFTALRRYRITAVEKPSRIVVEASRTDSGLPKGLLAESGSIAEPVREGSTPATPPVNLAEQLGLTVKTIMIDAGHGGKDPGAQHNGIMERNLTLKMANLVSERLRKQGFSVTLTRAKDEFIALDRRTQIANEKKADLFLSIHVNANRDERVCGFETYYLDYARTESASSVASRENASSGKSMNEIQSILADLIGRSKTQESLSLATLIQENALGSLRKKNFTAYDNGVRSALFLVLIGAQMPSVLIEVGYCTNTDEAKRLNSDAYLATMADGIVQGVLAYRDELGRLKQ